jgi:hypothetical protein
MRKEINCTPPSYNQSNKRKLSRDRITDISTNVNKQVSSPIILTPTTVEGTNNGVIDDELHDGLRELSSIRAHYDSIRIDGLMDKGNYAYICICHQSI